MKKNLPMLILMLMSAPFLYGCVGPAPKAKTQLDIIKKTVDSAKKEMTHSSPGYVSPNEKAIEEELKGLKTALSLTTPEDDLASLKKSYSLLSEEGVLKKFGGPPPTFTEEKIVDNDGQIRRIKFWIYSVTDPDGLGIWFRKLYSPRIKREQVYVRFTLAEGRVIRVDMGQSENELLQSIPGILRYAVTGAMIMK